MKRGHFLHCRDCEAVFRPSPADRTTEFQMTADGYSEVVRDDCMEFLARHARHQLETLRPTRSHPLHTGALWDTAAPTYWEVSNGTEQAVVEGKRSQIGGPLQYRLLGGRVVTERFDIEIPEDDIRQQIDRALFPGVAPHRKLDAFVDAFKAIVWRLDPSALEVHYDVPGDPTLAVARLPPAAMKELTASARRIFDQGDGAKIVAALTDTDDDPDAFTVLVRQRVRVEP